MAYIKKYTEVRPNETVPFWEYFSGSSQYTQEQIYTHFQMVVTERFPDPLTRIRITAWPDEAAYNTFFNDPGIAAGFVALRAYNEQNGITVTNTTDLT